MRGYIFTTGLLAAGLLVSGCAGGSQSLSPASGSLVPQAAFAPAAATNAIVNGSFTTGKLAPWAAFGKGAGAGTVTDKQHYGNTKYAGFMGTLTTPAVNLPHGMSQTITVPKNGKLTFWHEGNSTDEPKYGYYEVDVVSGGKTTLCYGGPNNSDTVLKWKEGGCSLAKFGGEKVTLKFYVYDNGYKSKYVNWYVDDVTVSG